MAKKFWFVIALYFIFILALAACGGSPEVVEVEKVVTVEVPQEVEVEKVVTVEVEKEVEVEKLVTVEAPMEVAQEKPIIVEFWHAMKGVSGEATADLVDRFNESQDKIIVVPTYQGSYDDTYTSLLTSFDIDTVPNIVQMYDTGTQTMIDTQRIIPVRELMEQEDYDPSVFEPAVRSYYSDSDGMVAMPFNSSTPLVYYNKDVFAEVGIEPPADGAWSFSELKAACDEIQASGVVENCVALWQHNWLFEEMLGSSGGLYFDNNNGRTGRATEIVYNEDLGVEILDFMTSLVADGYSANFGSSLSDARAAFLAGNAALILDSSGAGGNYKGNVDFEVGTMFIPYSDSSQEGFNGPVIGGAALWLLDTGDADAQMAAWEFMKFVADEPQQVTWHIDTGFFPVRQGLDENNDLQAFWEENPFFWTGVEQLAATKTMLADDTPNYAVLGGRAGPYPSLRNHIKEAFSWVLNDGLTPKEALDRAAEAANQELADYNAFFNE